MYISITKVRMGSCTPASVPSEVWICCNRTDLPKEENGLAIYKRQLLPPFWSGDRQRDTVLEAKTHDIYIAYKSVASPWSYEAYSHLTTVKRLGQSKTSSLSGLSLSHDV